MADNSTLPVAVGTEIFANKDVAGVKFPKVILHDTAGVPITQTGGALDINVKSGGLGPGQALKAASSPVALNTDAGPANPSAFTTRPGNTTAYVAGQLVANNTTAGSVVPLTFATAASAPATNFFIRGAKLKKSTTTQTNAKFRLHLYGVDPSLSAGIANGDGAAWSTNDSTYLGDIDFDLSASPARVMRDGVVGFGVPNTINEIVAALASGQTCYGLLEATAAYTPGAGEVFTVTLLDFQN